MTEPTLTFNNFRKTERIRPKFHPIIENNSPVKSLQFPRAPYSHVVWWAISDTIKWTPLVLEESNFNFSYVRLCHLDIPIVKTAKLFANSGNPDQMLHSATSDQGMHSLPITLLGVSRQQIVKESWTSYP